MSQQLPVVSHYEVVIVRESIGGFISAAGGGGSLSLDRNAGAGGVGGPLRNRTRETIGVVARKYDAFEENGFITAQKSIDGPDQYHAVAVSTNGIQSVEFIPVFIED